MYTYGFDFVYLLSLALSMITQPLLTRMLTFWNVVNISEY